MDFIMGAFRMDLKSIVAVPLKNQQHCDIKRAPFPECAWHPVSKPYLSSSNSSSEIAFT